MDEEDDESITDGVEGADMDNDGSVDANEMDEHMAVASTSLSLDLASPDGSVASAGLLSPTLAPGRISDDGADTLDGCLKAFACTDFAMEPELLKTVAKFIRCGGDPEVFLNLLCSNYVGLPQICNLMGEWLLLLNGNDVGSVQAIFEEALSQLIMKHFDPRKADRIFDTGGAAGGGSADEGAEVNWLPDFVNHSKWRTLIYQLAEQYPDCLMLNFAVKLISDAGYQHEITNVNTAVQQLEIFSRVLTNAVQGVFAALHQGADSEALEKALTELIRVGAHSEPTYLYCQSLFALLARRSAGDNSSAQLAYAAQFISQRLSATVQQDTTAMRLALTLSSAAAAAGSSSSCNPLLVQAMHGMLSKQTLNPADMTQIFNYYSRKDDHPPPVDLIRDQLFLDLVVDALFRPRGVKLHPEHRPKYLFLLAYAASAFEQTKKLRGKQVVNKDDLEATRQALDRMSQLCQERSGEHATHEILADLKQIFNHLKIPVVAAGVLHWIQCLVMEPNYYQLHPEPIPIHLALIDEIATNHPLLHSRVFKLLSQLLDVVTDFGGATVSAEASGGLPTDSGGLPVVSGGEGEKMLERQRTIVDRLVHLLSVGYAIPVTELIARKYTSGTADNSLVRYFVTETLEIVTPPYSSDFVRVFLPLTENREIVDASVHEKLSAAKEFIAHCREDEQLTGGPTVVVDRPITAKQKS